MSRKIILNCLAGIFSLAMGLGHLQALDGLEARPLHQRSPPHSAKMFVELPPGETGIVTENQYTDPAMWGPKFREFILGSLGTGVAVGDYDGDGLPDIFVVSKTGSCRLFHNLGNYRFEDVTDKAGVADLGEAAKIWKQGVTFVDVNNDGLLDIYVCRHNAPNLLYINQGDGTFREEALKRGLAVKDASVMAAFCDYDLDGWLDVYIATNLLDANAHPNGQRGRLFHNNRDGTFTEVTQAAGIFGESESHSATWWDFDGDGWSDLYVANDYAEPDRLYHNNRDGTFTDVAASVLPHIANASMGADVGDVTNEGRIDLFVADMAATSHTKDMRGMVKKRTGGTEPLATPDLLRQFPANTLFLNTGTGRCLEAANMAGIAATNWTWSVRLEDLDNDGRLDLHVTTGMVREMHNIDLMTRFGHGESAAEQSRLIWESPVFNEQNLAYRNLGGLKFQDVSDEWGLSHKGVSFGAAFGDLNGDGNLDLVVANYQGGVTVYRNECQTGHRVIIRLRGTASNSWGVGSTVRLKSASGQQVRSLVLARGYASSSDPVVHFGLGLDEKILELSVEWPSGARQQFSDLAVDQRYTITEPLARLHPEPEPVPPSQFVEVTESTGLALQVHEAPFDENKEQPLLPWRLNRSGPAVACADIEGYGEDGFVFGGTPVDPIKTLVETGGHFFPTGNLELLAPRSANQGPVLVFDANGDGRNDILVSTGGVNLTPGTAGYQPQLYINQGAGFFTPAPAGTLPDLPICVGAVAAADFTRNGQLGIFLGGRAVPGRYPATPRSALLAHRGDRFIDVTDELAPGLAAVGMVTGALWTDVDGDGWPDLLLTLDWGTVSYWHNDHGRKFEDWSVKSGFASAGTGWWNGLAAADFNGDGRLDYVVCNLGENTPYQVTPERPALLYSGVFEPGQPPQLLEATWEGNIIVPRRGRATLGTVFPSIWQRFPRNDTYASASLEEIFGAKVLAQAHRLTVTESRSGVFLSQPDGTYRFSPLPRITQIAPGQGVAAGDFDGDGHADIYLLHNSYAPVPDIGRFDGGLSQLLRGDGQGNFIPAPVRESGLLVPGDARGLAVCDLDHDGWPDFVLTRNNGPTAAFHNSGVAGRNSLKVRLHGRPGNAWAIGARVTAEYADGSTQTGEIHAGSGGMGQSTAALFFGATDVNPLLQLVVSWPDGTTRRHPGPFPRTTLDILEP